MNRRTLPVLTGLVLVLAMLGVTPAMAADTLPAGLSAEQQNTIRQLQTPAVVRGGGVAAPSASSTNAAYAAAATRRASIYRGSPLMWARDNVDFYYSSGRVTSSSGWQQAGAIFPNISRKLGTSRVYTSSSQHRWRGRYSIGAGIVTPWGDVTVYTADYATDMRVNGNGSWTARWQ